MVKSFRDLEVWKKSMDFAVHVYKVQRSFPETERFGLADQLRRAVVSIPSNIAEGVDVARPKILSVSFTKLKAR